MASRGEVLQATPSIVRTFHAGVLSQLPDLSDEEMMSFNRNPSALGPRLRDALLPGKAAGRKGKASAPPPHPESLLAWHEGWVEFWRQFGYPIDLANFPLPSYRPGFNWSIITPDGVSSNSRAYGICQSLFPCRCNINDLGVVRDIVSLSRVILIRDRVEADKELAGKSVSDLEEEKVVCITLRPRLILEARYFVATESHLDVLHSTLCVGSRDSDGLVPRAYWGGGKFCVHADWFSPGSRYPILRAREAVS